MASIPLRWRATIIAATLPAVMEVIWQLYNTYVPVFLQAGNPAFSDAGVTTLGFGLGPALTGFILVFDNIAGLFISPAVGAWSDSLRTRWGRRMPFILIVIPIAVITAAVIPLVPLGITPALNGQTGQLIGLLVPFVVAMFVVLLAFAVVRPAADVLLFDITRRRSDRPPTASPARSWGCSSCSPRWAVRRSTMCMAHCRSGSPPGWRSSSCCWPARGSASPTHSPARPSWPAGRSRCAASSHSSASSPATTPAA
jgi:hypothetical protein